VPGWMAVTLAPSTLAATAITRADDMLKRQPRKRASGYNTVWINRAGIHRRRRRHPRQSSRAVEELALKITEFAGHVNAAMYHWLMMIAEFDRLQGWADNANQSCAHWLNWKCGIALSAAREKVRVARALEKLPKMSAAMERGELSYSNVRALMRVACEATEDYLLMIARHGTAEHVERLVRSFRRCKEAEELSRVAQQHANRYLRYRYAEDGSLVLEAQLPAEVGALFLKALSAALPEPSPRSSRAATFQLKRPSHECRSRHAELTSWADRRKRPRARYRVENITHSMASAQALTVIQAARQLFTHIISRGRCQVAGREVSTEHDDPSYRCSREEQRPQPGSYGRASRA